MIVKSFKRAFEFLSNNDGHVRQKAIRSAYWVGFSNIIISLLSLVRSIILARLLMPEVFGLMAISSIIIRCLETFTQTGIGAALIYFEKDSNTTNTAFTINLLRGIILSILAVLIAPFLANYYNKPIIEIIVKILAVNFVLGSLKNIHVITLQKDLDFKRITYAEQLSFILSFLVTIGFVYFRRDIWALVTSNVLGVFIELLISYFLIPGKPSLKFCKKTAKKLIGYGGYVSGVTIVVFASTEIDNAIVGKMLGMNTLGYYLIAYNLANIPVNFVTNILAKVLVPAYTMVRDDTHKLHTAFYSVFKWLSFINLPISALMLILASEIIGSIYGRKWMPAVEALQVLSYCGLLRSLSGSAGSLLNAVGYPKYIFHSVSLRLIILLSVIYPLTSRLGILGTSYAVAIAMSIEQIYLWTTVNKLLNISIIRLMSEIKPQFISTIVMIIVLLVSKAYLNLYYYSILTLILYSIIAIISYLTIYFCFRPNEASDLINKLKSNLLQL